DPVDYVEAPANLKVANPVDYVEACKKSQIILIFRKKKEIPYIKWNSLTAAHFNDNDCAMIAVWKKYS
ncbi:MAG: hypothetical protein IJ252_04420, partial [Solobacterium sp.]|nr:hypothetical protein [Solobacterium sp.]